MVNAFGSVASKQVREVITFELQRLAQEFPDWAAFGQRKVLDLLKGKGTAMDEFTHSFTPTLTLAVTPTPAQAQGLHTATATTTTTETSSRRSPERGIPEGWKPTADHRVKAEEKHLDVMLLAEAFRNHAEANDRRARNWDAAFRNWILKATPGTPPQQRNVTAQYSWANS